MQYKFVIKDLGEPYYDVINQLKDSKTNLKQ
jgi:hypothetical protein